MHTSPTHKHTQTERVFLILSQMAIYFTDGWMCGKTGQSDTQAGLPFQLVTNILLTLGLTLPQHYLNLTHTSR